MGNDSRKALLIILDGFGIGRDSPFNAIENAQMPFYRDLVKNYPHSKIMTHGEYVGLPDGIMGNSEVGHMTMGSGRIIFQDLVRINRSIQDKSFFKNEALVQTLKAAQNGHVHLMGLVSDGGVHSHLDHLLALLDLCADLKIPKVSVHPFLDGRDTPPQSAGKFLETLLKHPTIKNPGETKAQIASLSGRYWAMDRDKRWDRIDRAFEVLTGKTQTQSIESLNALEASYQNKKTDEFLEPVLLCTDGTIQDGDSVVFFNFRADRARQLTSYLTDSKKIKLSAFTSLTEYDSKFTYPVAFPPIELKSIFPEVLAKRGLKQLHIAETEKYAHVTFFFNGGKEKPFQGEDRLLIDSPKSVPTYDLKPEMSAFQIADELSKKISQKKYDFIVANFANADMVGHTGNYEAAVRAMEALDQCLGKVIGQAEKNGYHVLITADHGNAEEMEDSHGDRHTQHTLNPVPAIWIEPGTSIAPQNTKRALKDGGLPDIIPTICEIMNLDQPEEMTGKSLLPGKP